MGARFALHALFPSGPSCLPLAVRGRAGRLRRRDSGGAGAVLLGVVLRATRVARAYFCVFALATFLEYGYVRATGAVTNAIDLFVIFENVRRWSPMAAIGVNWWAAGPVIRVRGRAGVGSARDDRSPLRALRRRAGRHGGAAGGLCGDWRSPGADHRDDPGLRALGHHVCVVHGRRSGLPCGPAWGDVSRRRRAADERRSRHRRIRARGSSQRERVPAFDVAVARRAPARRPAHQLGRRLVGGAPFESLGRGAPRRRALAQSGRPPVHAADDLPVREGDALPDASLRRTGQQAALRSDLGGPQIHRRFPRCRSVR